MNCPICGNELRPSKKDPSYGLCDNCKKKFKLAEETTAAPKKKAAPAQTSKPKKATGNPAKSTKSSSPKKRVDDSVKAAPVKSTAKSKPKKSVSVDYDYEDDVQPKKKKGGCLKFFLIFILIIGLLAGALFFFGKSFFKESTGEDPVETENVVDETNETVPQNVGVAYGVGDTVEQDGIEITLVSATKSEGGDYASPSDGNVFLICEFEITNNSDTDITISSFTNIEAYCDDYSVSEDLTGLLVPEAGDKNSLDGAVASGKKLNGIVAYQIPSTFTNFELRVAPDFWSTNIVTFYVANE